MLKQAEYLLFVVIIQTSLVKTNHARLTPTKRILLKVSVYYEDYCRRVEKHHFKGHGPQATLFKNVGKVYKQNW